MMDQFSGKRWALQWPSEGKRGGTPDVRHFWTEIERNEWLRQNPCRREAVGVRNPHVKAWRDRQAESKR